jgi:hypothetical protein
MFLQSPRPYLSNPSRNSLPRPKPRTRRKKS